MPRPRRNRADVLKAAAAREAAKATKSADGGAVTGVDKILAAVVAQNKSEEATNDKAAATTASETSDNAAPGNNTNTAPKTRIAQEMEAASRAIDSLRNSKGGAVSTPRGKTRATRREPAPSTLQVQRSQEPVEAPATNRRARNIPMAPMSVRKPMSTPRAEASMLALANFKRRSRAPSILGIGNADETASISSDGSFGDLMPDDESTPLPKGHAQSQLDRQLLQGVTPKAGEDDSTLAPNTDSSRKRKRDSEILVPASQSSEGGVTTRRTRSRIEISSGEEEEEEEDSSDDSPPSLPRYAQPASPSVSSSVMAPPASSSPVKPRMGRDEAANEPASPSQGRRGRSKAAAGPGIAKTWAKTRAVKSPKKVDTASLQQLLPKRRQVGGRRGDFDIYSSDEHEAGSGDDEPSYAPSKRGRKGTGSRKQQRPALAQRAVPAATRRTRNVAKKNKEPKKAADDINVSRTYSRRSTGKENLYDSETEESEGEVGSAQEQAEETSTLPQEPSRELLAAVEKFAEVDQWEMDFEEAPSSTGIVAGAR